MKTSRSPRKVLRFAYRLGRRVLPDHACTFSRQDFTLAQLFACLVLREFFGLSYRRTEALLADSPAWLADIGLVAAPDHNTLWRAFERIVTPGRVNRMLDRLVAAFARARLLRLRSKPLALDSTCFHITSSAPSERGTFASSIIHIHSISRISFMCMLPVELRHTVAAGSSGTDRNFDSARG
jgi:hypothetical protein